MFNKLIKTKLTDHFLAALVNSFHDVSSHFFSVMVTRLAANLKLLFSGSIFSYNLNTIRVGMLLE